MWGDKAEVMFAQHHWPTWGNDEVVELLENAARPLPLHQRRDPAAGQPGLHDASRSPSSSSCRRSLAHTSGRTAATTARSTTTSKPPTCSISAGSTATRRRCTSCRRSRPASSYVEFMGGADAVLQKAKESFDKGDYRWVAEVVNHVVFADPSNQAAKDLQADALEQLGYQAEQGPGATSTSPARRSCARACSDCRRRTPPAPIPFGR